MSINLFSQITINEYCSQLAIKLTQVTGLISGDEAEVKASELQNSQVGTVEMAEIKASYLRSAT